MDLDFKDLLYKSYVESNTDIPMVAEVISTASIEIARVVETVRIAFAALRAVAGAGLDPNLFTVVNAKEYRPDGILFFKGSDEDWEYCLAGSSGVDGDAPIDVMKKKPGDDHWQIIKDGVWIDNGPPVGFLEQLNARFSCIQQQEDTIKNEENTKKPGNTDRE